MNQSPTSLDRLHDILLPDAVGLWPPAAGWYGVMAVVVIGMGLLGYRLWNLRRANAYRRAALRELAAAGDGVAIAEILRRVALSIAPRHVIAAQVGKRWPQWLAACCAEPMPPDVRAQLAGGVYCDGMTDSDVEDLRQYAARWISSHQKLTKSPDKSDTETPG